MSRPARNLRVPGCRVIRTHYWTDLHGFSEAGEEQAPERALRQAGRLTALPRSAEQHQQGPPRQRGGPCCLSGLAVISRACTPSAGWRGPRRTRTTR